MSELLSVAAALELIDSHSECLAPRPALLSEALGRRLAQDIASDVHSPPHDKAMMDGYAVRSGDGQADRRVIEEVFAGDVPQQQLSAGEATRIMTGSPMPHGADAVIPVELSELAGDVVRLMGDAPVTGKHVMPRGEAIQAGQVVLTAGALLGPAQIALLAEVGFAEPLVTPRPTVAVLPTGAELVAPDQRPGPGQIRNSNGPMLLAAVRQAGCESVDLGVATDDPAALREAILRGRTADVLLVSGGVSAGDRDLAPAVLQELGIEQVLHKVAVKPGKPLWFGVWPPSDRHTNEAKSRAYVFGLPGNPVSSFVCFQLFVRPLLERLAGGPFRGLTPRAASLGKGVSHRGGRETFLPARLETRADGVLLVTPTPWRGSADLLGLAAANALIRLSAAPAELSPGEIVTVYSL